MNKLQIVNLDLSKKKVLLRVDFNVPLNESLEISDDTRIQLALPTIKFLLNQNCAIILLSHLGRPDGKIDPKFSLKPCVDHLEKLLKKTVKLAADCTGEETEKLAKHLLPGEILCLENLRFYDAEKHPDKDPSFAKKIASYGDCFINDAFATCHRRHSSIISVPSYFPKCSAMGFLLIQEIENFSKYFSSPKKPFYAVVGGSKVESKIGVLKALLAQVNALFIGGAMSLAMLEASGVPIKTDKANPETLNTCKNLLNFAQEKKIPIYLPNDFVCSNNLENPTSIKLWNLEDIFPENLNAYDIGPKTIDEWKLKIKDSQTLFWNGPVGVFEKKEFANGTFELAKAIGKLDSIKIAGGGDSLCAISQLHLNNCFTHLSTGGGAFLELIEFKTLPGVEALTNLK